MSEKKSVLHIIETIGVGGGAEVLLANTVTNLPRLNNIVVTLYPYHKEYDLGNAAVYCLNIKSWRSFIGAIPKLRKIIKENNVQLIHAHLFRSVWLARLAKPRSVKLVISIHNLLSLDLFRNGSLALWWEKRFMNRQDAVIAVSKTVLEDYVNVTGFRKKRFVLYNFVPDYFFDSPVDCTMNGAKINCVTVGHFKAQKNQAYLIKAFKGLPSGKIQLDLYGEGPLENEMAELIRQEKVHSACIAGLSENMHKVLRQYTVFISASEYEGFGIALVEAMAGGLICIVSDIPVHREVAGDACLYFDIKSPDSLQTLLKQMLERKIDVGDLPSKARERAFKISNKEKYLNGIQEIYREIIK